MSTRAPHEHDHANNLVYGLGLLDDDDPATAAAQQALSECEECRTELAELRAVSRHIEDVDPEMFLDGDPDADRPGDAALQGVLSQIRAMPRSGPPETLEHRENADGEASAEHPDSVMASSVVPLRRRTGRTVGWLVAAAAALVLAVAGGVVLGRASAPPTVVAQQEPGTGSLTEGDRAVQGRNGDVTMTAVLTDADGWVRVSASTDGIPLGSRCEIVVRAADGSEQVAGSWVVAPSRADGGEAVEGSASVPPAEVAAVVIRDSTTGRDVVTADV